MNKREYCGLKMVVDNETYNEYKGTLQEQIEKLQQENQQLKERIDKIIKDLEDTLKINKHFKDNEGTRFEYEYLCLDIDHIKNLLEILGDSNE